MTAKILVVDDDLLHRELVRAALAGMCTVIEAEDAEGALRTVQREAIDLAVLDIVMPGETGVELCRKIKTLTNEQVPVLMVTALSDREHRLAGLAAGADDFLTKPFDRTELRLRVDMFLRLRGQERTIREQLRALQRLDALKDDLVSLLVHDLKHPLSGVFAWLALAKTSATPDNADELDQALAAAGRVRDAINDLLQIRALEAGRLTPALAPVPLEPLLRDAAAGFEASARGRSLTIEVQTVDVTVDADRALLRRALDNLLANAIRYAPPGSAVELRAANEGDAVSLTVTDCGPGVPDERKAELFTKFGTLDDGALRTRRGFGLGLYLVQLVAEAHQGQARVRDRPGGGAIFELTIASHR
ncbi:MAG: hybrid sensor histidine kinase/response regulator [Deltaproteobacteria bacterium]|nr:hybrid sensor histidine kinase/response regulator [Deltaproteobacteria bacterium]